MPRTQPASLGHVVAQGFDLAERRLATVDMRDASRRSLDIGSWDLAREHDLLSGVTQRLVVGAHQPPPSEFGDDGCLQLQQILHAQR
ncbi:MAG: hypothetical protein LBE67_15060 [Kocuria palustris]|nr:hypothetical protein [Kocuria palustris]